MSVLSDYVGRLVEAGLDQDEAMQIAAEIFAAGAASQASRPSAGALRTRKWRLKNASPSVTCDADGIEAGSVTKRHKASQSVTCDNTPLSSLNIDNRKKGARLSQDWSPSDADRAFATQLGWANAQIDSEAANFRDYWIAKPGSGGCKLDWPATWRKWIRSSKVKPAASPVVHLVSGTDWDAILTTYKKIGVWSQRVGSPPPGDPDCTVPRDKLLAHGFGEKKSVASVAFEIPKLKTMGQA